VPLNPAEYFDTCTFCGQLPTHFRATGGSNPIGGFDEHGKSRTEEELNQWLELQLVTATPWPKRIDATCDEHLWFEHLPDGSARLSVAGEVQQRLARQQPDQPSAPKSLRQQALDFYGGKCTECGETEPALLRIYPLPGTPTPKHPDGSKLRKADKLRYLKEHYFPRGWVLRCPQHPVVQRAQPASISLRQRILAAYGEVCGECNETQNLQIWCLPGTEIPLSPSGLRLRGEAKLRYLRRMGFPQGWVLRCPEHPVR
jgi:hypothetical protein